MSFTGEQSAGRCSTCRFLRDYELPLRTIYFCQALGHEMTGAEKDAVRGCRAWREFRPVTLAARRRAAAGGQIGRELLALEDRLFGALRQALDARGADLRTLMMLAHPSIEGPEQLAWLDELEPQLGAEPLSELIERLRELRYDDLADLIEPLAERPAQEGA